MIDRSHEQLLQDVLDGQATPGDVARLEAWLAASEEGRTRKQELEGVFQALGRMPRADAPEGLVREVQAAIDARRAERSSPPRPRWEAGWRLKLAYVFTAGIAAGVIGFGVLTTRLGPAGPGARSTVGAMMPTPEATSEAVQASWSAGRAWVEGVAWKAGETRLVSLRVRRGAPAQVELAFDPGALSVGAVRRSDGLERVDLGPGRILARAAGPGELIIEFQEADPRATIHVAVRSGEATVSHDLAAPAGGAR